MQPGKTDAGACMYPSRVTIAGSAAAAPLYSLRSLIRMAETFEGKFFFSEHPLADSPHAFHFLRLVLPACPQLCASDFSLTLAEKRSDPGERRN